MICVEFFFFSGEARSGLAPNKPVRTGSLREANMENGKRLVAVSSQPEDSGYESFDVSLSTIQSMESNLVSNYVFIVL